MKDLFSCGERTAFAGMPHDFGRTVEKGHEGIETCRCWTVDDREQLAWLDIAGDWLELRSVAMVLSERREGERVSVEPRYYISSLESDAGRMLRATRSHWGIENSVHWVLDVSFREDESRIRSGNASEIIAIVRQMALNLLRQDPTSKPESTEPSGWGHWSGA